MSFRMPLALRHFQSNAMGRRTEAETLSGAPPPSHLTKQTKLLSLLYRERDTVARVEVGDSETEEPLPVSFVGSEQLCSGAC
mmetsp:Transcript_58732/g.138335  ORF Transcript_58732/g.138335 Transcript_58732/m.138335 type:complete len:82 (-) Transcript_58732:169-414(-)